MFEYPNNFGAYSKDMYDYNSNFLNPLNYWEWGTLDFNNMFYASTAKLLNEKNIDSKIIHVSDKIIDLDGVLKIVEKHQPIVLILNSIKTESKIIEKSENPDSTLQIIIIQSCNINTIYNLNKKFQNINRLYIDKLTGGNKNETDISFDSLFELSIGTAEDVSFLDYMNMPKLTSLSIFRMISSESKNIENLPYSLTEIRISLNVLPLMIDFMINLKNLETLHIYSKKGLKIDDKNLDLIFNIINTTQPNDLIIPENCMDIEKIRLMSYMREIHSLGVYINDKNLNTFIELFPFSLIIYDNVIKQYQCVVRENTLLANYNIFHNENSKNLIDDQILKYNLDVLIENEVLYDDSYRIPSISRGQRSRKISIYGNEIIIEWSCGHLNSIIYLFKEIIEKYDKMIQKIKFTSLGQNINKELLINELEAIDGITSVDIESKPFKVL